jgi:hypothetical protein
MPALVAAAGTPEAVVGTLRAAFVAAAARHWFEPYRDLLLLEGFAAASAAHFATTLAWDREARAAGYDVPA